MEEEKGIEIVALESLGKGFDLASDFRLRFAKGIRDGVNSRKRLVVLDEENKRDILIPGAGGATVIKGVSENIRCDKGDRIRFKSDVLEFNQVHFLSLFSVSRILISNVLNCIQASIIDIVENYTEMWLMPGSCLYCGRRDIENKNFYVGA
jgi:hypothetical protein